MALLLFEIWDCPDSESCGFQQVSRENDEMLRRMEPNRVLIARFHAASDFEAFQKNNDWHGFGPWKPEPGWDERFFTEAEAAEQAAYLNERQPNPSAS